MSSNIVAGDNQKPALIIANGAACNNELLEKLVKCSSLVIVLDAAIKRVISLGIKIDVLLGDFDNGLKPEKYEDVHYPTEIVYTPDQNKTDLEKAFDYLMEKNITAVSVVWATGKRADHNITNITSVVKFRNRLNIVILDDYSKIFLLPKKFEKWYTAGTPISLIPIGIVSGILTKNLKYPLREESLILGYRTGSSNEATSDGIVYIEHDQGDLLMMECCD